MRLAAVRPVVVTAVVCALAVLVGASAPVRAAHAPSGRLAAAENSYIAGPELDPSPPPAGTADPAPSSTLSTTVARPAMGSFEVVPPQPAAAPDDRTAVERTVPGGRTLALTFDDGPDPRWTPRVLTLLRAAGVHATFCVVGEQVAAHPELVARIAAEGHRLCNHTQTHDERLATRSDTEIEHEVLGASAATHKAAPDARVDLFRAPGGFFTAHLDTLVAGWGLRPLGWSVDPDDWRRPGTQAIVTRVLTHVHPGAIVLLHDGGGNRAQTIAALPLLLAELTRQGYRFTEPAH